MPERLQKILANTGLGSRRELESWISNGDIRINGRQAVLGDKADLNDDLAVKGRFYKVVPDDQQTRRVIMYHKPIGQVTTRDDPEGRRTVFDTLPKLHHGRWIAVGRLDINTLGLLLLTNDGELANALMHPSSGFERQYAVRVNGRVGPDVIDRLATGVALDDGPAKFDRIVMEQESEGSNQWFRVTVKEGRNRLVRRLWESQEVQVARLIRTRYGPINLPRWLVRGKVHELPAAEVSSLAQSAGLPPGPAARLRVIPVHPRHRRKARQRADKRSEQRRGQSNARSKQAGKRSTARSRGAGSQARSKVTGKQGTRLNSARVSSERGGGSGR